MILDIEHKLRHVDTLLGYVENGLYHISSRDKIKNFGQISDNSNNILYTLDDVLNSNDDVWDLSGNLVLSNDSININSISDSAYYSIIGYKIFKDILEYKIYLSSRYKDFMYKEPLFNNGMHYYNEYFRDLDNYCNNDMSIAIQKIIQRFIGNNIDRNTINNIISIYVSILNNIDSRIFSSDRVYRVTGDSYYIIIEDLGNVFELRYKDLLLEHKRILL